MLRLRSKRSLFVLAALLAQAPLAARAEEKPDDPKAAAPVEPKADRTGDAHDKAAKDPRADEDAAKKLGGRFEFGSYGRVNVASDLRGGTGRSTNVVAFGSRLDLDSYAELEFRREDTLQGGISTRIVTTVALLPPFFHFSGKANDALALRQLYVQGQLDDWTLWAGVRMYRGDDIYLLNWWPLDNQNTVGGGVGKKLASDTMVALHVGMQRLDNPMQLQTVPNVAPLGAVGSVDVTTLDRPRTIETLKITQFLRNTNGKTTWSDDRQGFKASLYGEAHQLPSGVRRDTTLNIDKSLPADSGFLVGAQLTYWTGERDGYVSLWARHARALAAYDPLETPTTYAPDRTTTGTTESRVALAGNYETGPFGVMAAGYLRFFRDGGPAVTSPQKYDEGILIARPQVYLGEHFGLAVEGSYQARRYALVDPSNDAPLTASLMRLGGLAYFSPAGRGSFKRPQLGVVYNASMRSATTRSLYAKDDVFSQRGTEHYAGIFAEWWFNSSSYP